jgi:succinate dehydrogenase / fumarate reductase flavoprotein subunit
MDQEIKEGRGCGPNKDYINLDMTHLGGDTILKRLPSVFEIGHNFANVDITKEPIPVVPTIHYQMGGIPTNIHGQVVVPKGGEPERGRQRLYAVGECSCVSVHGANRLGTNSLLDLLVFGRAAGNHIVDQCGQGQAHKPLPADAADYSLARLARLDGSSSGRVRAGRGQRPAQHDAASTPACSARRPLMDEGVARSPRWPSASRASR